MDLSRTRKKIKDLNLERFKIEMQMMWDLSKKKFIRGSTFTMDATDIETTEKNVPAVAKNGKKEKICKEKRRVDRDREDHIRI